MIPFVASTEIDATGSEMGIIFAIRTVGYIILAPIIGSLADRISSKLLISIGSAGRGIAYFILYYSIIFNSLGMMIFGNFLLGGMAAFYWIPLDILISQKSKPENRSEGFGRRTSAIGVGTTLGAVIGFATLGYFSEITPNNSYLIYSALFIYGVGNVLAVFLYQRIDEDLRIGEQLHPESTGYLPYLRGLQREFFIALFLMLFVMFLASTNGSIAKPFIIVYLTKNIESDPTLASFAYIPAGITSMLLAGKLGQIADKLNPTKVIAGASIVGSLTTYLLITTNSLIVFSILLVIDTTIVTTVELVIHNILSRISIQNRGKIFGLQTVFTDIGAIVGPVVGGIMWDTISQKAPFIFSIIIEILLIPFIILSIKKITPFLSEQAETKEYEITEKAD